MKWVSSSIVVMAAVALCSVLPGSGNAAFILQQEPGEQIMIASCTACHDFRPIYTKALDSDGWKTVIAQMTERGAQVSAENMPVLVDYLVKYHGPLPDGEGKDILLNTCTLCHDLERVKEHRGGAGYWSGVLQNMMNEGAQLTEEEFVTLVNYLATGFGG